jgi:hypothetical protein
LQSNCARHKTGKFLFVSFGLVSGHDFTGSQKARALYQGTTLVGPYEIEELMGFSPCHGASCKKCSSRESFEQRTDVLRNDEN